MTDHHDFGDHHEFADHDPHHEDVPLGFDDHDHSYATDDHDDAWHTPDHDLSEVHHDDAPVEHAHDTTTTSTDDGAAGDAAVHEVHVEDSYSDPSDVFPPQVDVGDLPEPVDGFPWIDTATLGAGHTDTADYTPVEAHELAEYAGTEIPPGADPWAVLADSDDPATSTLARFFRDTSE